MLILSCLLSLLNAAAAPDPQDNVISETKSQALYLWITVKPLADARKCAAAVNRLEEYVNEISPFELRDADNEILAGVGFGPNFLSRIGGIAPEEFPYAMRSGDLGTLPSTGGDIFVHAKSNKMSKLYELTQRIKQEMPAGSVHSFEDTYGWVFRNGRDLSGFIDGTENPAGEQSRAQVALNKATRGSFCITQKWIHDHATIHNQTRSTLESWVGRDMEYSTELERKSITSHVARMTAGPEYGVKGPFKIVRQSQPFGTVGGESGLFFIGFAESPRNFDHMLDRMTGTPDDPLSDDIMRLSRCVTGTYWYFPSKEELKSLATLTYSMNEDTKSVNVETNRVASEQKRSADTTINAVSGANAFCFHRSVILLAFLVNIICCWIQ